MYLPLIIIGKIVSFVSRLLNIGHGATWPGEIVLFFKPDILNYLQKFFSRGIILVAGTNGKTTTSLLIKKILEKSTRRIILNESGANLLNGVVSAILINFSLRGKSSFDYGIFEIDENSLPLILKFISPKVLIITNLFRDQLDRYGEIDVILEKWQKSFANLPASTNVILNCDDPAVASLGSYIKSKIFYYGLNNRKLMLPEIEHASDSIFCVKCGRRLKFEGVYYSHLGIWSCNCGNSRPKPNLSDWPSPLPGLYNLYNTLAAVSVAIILNIKKPVIESALEHFEPAFGRQEVFEISGKFVKIFLSKNPAGFNESLRTVISLKAKYLLLVLNDRIPDGTDVSWIWDVDFELIANGHELFVSGDRCYDMALRLKHADCQIQNTRIYTNLNEALKKSIESLKSKETLYVLATYSAMLEVRKILTGRMIL